MLSLSDNQKIGVILVTLGCLFLCLGILLFFDAGLLAIGALSALAFTQWVQIARSGGARTERQDTAPVVDVHPRHIVARSRRYGLGLLRPALCTLQETFFFYSVSLLS